MSIREELMTKAKQNDTATRKRQEYEQDLRDQARAPKAQSHISLSEAEERLRQAPDGKQSRHALRDYFLARSRERS